MTTRRQMIETALADGPLTGAQIRARLPIVVAAIPVHRQLGEMTRRGQLTRRFISGLWHYALPTYEWPAPRRPSSVWDWRASA